MAWLCLSLHLFHCCPQVCPSSLSAPLPEPFSACCHLSLQVSLCLNYSLCPLVSLGRCVRSQSLFGNMSGCVHLSICHLCLLCITGPHCLLPSSRCLHEPIPATHLFLCLSVRLSPCDCPSACLPLPHTLSVFLSPLLSVLVLFLLPACLPVSICHCFSFYLWSLLSAVIRSSIPSHCVPDP